MTYRWYDTLCADNRLFLPTRIRLSVCSILPNNTFVSPNIMLLHQQSSWSKTVNSITCIPNAGTREERYALRNCFLLPLQPLTIPVVPQYVIIASIIRRCIPSVRAERSDSAHSPPTSAAPLWPHLRSLLPIYAAIRSGHKRSAPAAHAPSATRRPPAPAPPTHTAPPQSRLPALATSVANPPQRLHPPAQLQSTLHPKKSKTSYTPPLSP